MDEVFGPIGVVALLFVALPWLILHYVTRWKTAATISTSDEDLLDELHELARRLDDRMVTIERIMAADNPNWRPADRDTLSRLARPSSEPSFSRLGEIDPDPTAVPQVRSNQPSGRL